MISPTQLALFALSTGFATVGAQSTGSTGKHWDCCKGSCGWPNKNTVSAPVATCDKSDNPLKDTQAVSGCIGGIAYMCTNQSPWAVNDNLAYGYASINLSEYNYNCCACYELTFTSGSVQGKKMVVQVTDSGSKLSPKQFDLVVPGGGAGTSTGCNAQFGAPPSGWGVSKRSDCDSFPQKLKSGCYWRFDWFKNADNPSVSYKEVSCPAALTGKTGCVRN